MCQIGPFLNLPKGEGGFDREMNIILSVWPQVFFPQNFFNRPMEFYEKGLQPKISE